MLLETNSGIESAAWRDRHSSMPSSIWEGSVAALLGLVGLPKIAGAIIQSPSVFMIDRMSVVSDSVYASVDVDSDSLVRRNCLIIRDVKSSNARVVSSHPWKVADCFGSLPIHKRIEAISERKVSYGRSNGKHCFPFDTMIRHRFSPARFASWVLVTLAATMSYYTPAVCYQ